MFDGPLVNCFQMSLLLLLPLRLLNPETVSNTLDKMSANQADLTCQGPREEADSRSARAFLSTDFGRTRQHARNYLANSGEKTSLFSKFFV